MIKRSTDTFSLGVNVLEYDRHSFVPAEIAFPVAQIKKRTKNLVNPRLDRPVVVAISISSEKGFACDVIYDLCSAWQTLGYEPKMNALAAWTGRRPTPASVDVEPMAEGGELIGQELVPVTAPMPVIPLTSLATSRLGGELEAGRGGDHQFAGGQGGDQQLALLPHGDVPKGGESEGLLPEEVRGNGFGGRPGELEPMMTMGASTGIPNGGGLTSTAMQEHAVEKGMDGVWPGGPMTARPRSFGPTKMPSPGGPLFDYEQLRRFQELYESAPGIYGQTQPKEVSRPEVLQEEEELQRRLAEIQDQKKKAQEEWEQRQLRAQQERFERESRPYPRDAEKSYDGEFEVERRTSRI